MHCTFVLTRNPNAVLFCAEIIIDRCHIIQMAGRLLDNARIQLLKQIKDHRCREYKVLKAQWRLFHKDDDQLESAKPVFLRGINEFMTQQDAIDLILRKYPDLRGFTKPIKSFRRR